VVKGEVCKTSIQRFESARRLHFPRTNHGSGALVVRRYYGRTYGRTPGERRAEQVGDGPRTTGIGCEQVSLVNLIELWPSICFTSSSGIPWASAFVAAE